MKCPSNISAEAKKFYKSHASRLISEKVLTESNFDTFILLCRTYSILENLKEDDRNFLLSWNGTMKTFERLAIQFGIFNKKQAAPKIDITEILEKM